MSYKRLFILLLTILLNVFQQTTIDTTPERQLFVVNKN
jgi:hypothetical protein